VVDRLSRHFVPLYVENDAAEQILRSHGQQPYADEEWQLVQTWLVLPDGELRELWRPGPRNGDGDQGELLRALDGAISDLALVDLPAPAPHENQRLAAVGEDGALLEVVIRVPRQEAHRNGRNFTVDWIPLEAGDVAALLPPAGALARDVAPALARRILVHLRPPLDTATDPHEAALARMAPVHLETWFLEEGAGFRRYGLAGSMRIGPAPGTPAEPMPGRADAVPWSDLRDVMVEIDGFIDVEAATGRVTDLQVRTTAADAVPPTGQLVHFDAVARFVGAGTRRGAAPATAAAPGR
jgi:hypothetical protein